MAASEVKAKRAYDPPEPGDGHRVLVDHVWPRGVKREALGLDEWARELAPSDELRRWFGHEPARFAEFRRRYREELATHGEKLDALRALARSAPVTVVYAARDREHNNGVVVAELLRER